MKRTLFLAAIAAAMLLLFGQWPEIDLAASRLFFDGTGFPLARDPAHKALRWSLRVLPFLPPLAGLCIILVDRWRPGPVLGLGKRAWAIICLVFVLGPGLMANLIAKSHWGRARPRNVTEFGGDKLFTPPHQWADQCAANCSFVSGEVSAVTALSVALIFLLNANRGKLGNGGFRCGVVVAFVLPVLSAYQRVSAGAHFLSDTILAVVFTLLVAHWVQALVDPKPR